MTSATKTKVLQMEAPNPTTTAEDDDANGPGGALSSLVPSDPEEYQALEKKLVQKIDWRLMPVLVAMIILK
jgi:hypothetical protein